MKISGERAISAQIDYEVASSGSESRSARARTKRLSRVCAWALVSTALAGTLVIPNSAARLAAQDSAPATAPAEVGTPINNIIVEGNQRFEDATVLSYLDGTGLRIGGVYNQRVADEGLRSLYSTELFADVAIRNDAGVITIIVVENPIVNRILVEGNKSIKDEKVLPEIKLGPRQIFTRSKVRADTARIIELYKRKGRFAATVEPKMVMLDQNRVDIVFEIVEGPKSKVRQINIIGNNEFSDGKLRGTMLTKQSSFLGFLKGNTTYDPDKLAYDQQKLRQFYLVEGYADFRVVSAVAELTPDREDFIVTYVVDEGKRYKFGKVELTSAIRDLPVDLLNPLVDIKEGDWYNAQSVEDIVERIKENAGLFGYANPAVNPQFRRNPETQTMDVTFAVEQSPRVYIDRIEISGNSSSRDKVIRREMRVAEGDAFNSFQILRSENRIKSLGYFQEDFKIDRVEGDTPDRYNLLAAVQEGNTGELQLSAGYSSYERFIFSGSVKKRNFRGLGQELRASASYSRYSKSFELGFTEPYFLDKNIALAGDIFRRDYNSFNYIGSDRQTTYSNATTGFQLRSGLPVTEYMYFALRYGLDYQDVTLDETRFYSLGTDGVSRCDPLLAGRYLCDAIGKRWTSTLGMSLSYDVRDNSYRPTRGHSITANLDWAGLGGDVKYLRGRLNADKYFNLGSGFIFSLRGEGGYIKALEKRTDGTDAIRLTDRFFLGEPELRGFDIRGVGPRVIRYGGSVGLDTGTGLATFTQNTDRNNAQDDALGGHAYYLGRMELEIPLGSGARDMGLRPSIFLDAGSVWSVKRPQLTSISDFTDTDGNVKSKCIVSGAATTFASETTTTDSTGATVGTGIYSTCTTGSAISPYNEVFLGDTWKPRVAVGVGVNWRSPFGPFRIDFAKDLIKQEGDDTKRFSINVGTSF